jgi:hypothetical protein
LSLEGGIGTLNAPAEDKANKSETANHNIQLDWFDQTKGSIKALSGRSEDLLMVAIGTLSQSMTTTRLP